MYTGKSGFAVFLKIISKNSAANIIMFATFAFNFLFESIFRLFTVIMIYSYNTCFTKAI
jgi:hypothetical protein